MGQDSETFSTWQIEKSDFNEPALNLPSPVSAIKRDSRLPPPIHGNNNFLTAGLVATEYSAGSQTYKEERYYNKQLSSVKYDKKLKNEGELRKHAIVHGNQSHAYMCSLCKKRFSKSVDWNMHVRAVHTAQERFMIRGFGEKTYSCYYCHKKFKKMGDLRKHDRVNTGDIPFNCSKCQVKLERECDMWKHEQSHSENNSNKNKATESAVVKPFACSKCCSKFAKFADLKNHETAVHGIRYDENPFGCHVCDERFKTYNSLKKHKGIHIKKKFSCTQCGQKFDSERDLINHYQITRHSNWTTASSETNQRSTFNTATDVKQVAQTQKSKKHKTPKTQKLPFRCSECNMKFPNLLALNQHKTAHVSSQEKFSGNAFTRKIMRQQGWKSGQGLGADCSGITDPVDTRGQMTRTGLGYTEVEEGVPPPLASKQPKIDECNKKPQKANSQIMALNGWMALNQQKTAHVVQLRCPICDKKFAGPYVLKQHKRSCLSHEANKQKVKRKKKKSQNKQKVKKNVKTDYGFPDLFKSKSQS